MPKKIRVRVCLTKCLKSISHNYCHCFDLACFKGYKLASYVSIFVYRKQRRQVIMKSWVQLNQYHAHYSLTNWTVLMRVPSWKILGLVIVFNGCFFEQGHFGVAMKTRDAASQGFQPIQRITSIIVKGLQTITEFKLNFTWFGSRIVIVSISLSENMLLLPKKVKLSEEILKLVSELY